MRWQKTALIKESPKHLICMQLMHLRQRAGPNPEYRYKELKSCRSVPQTHLQDVSRLPVGSGNTIAKSLALAMVWLEIPLKKSKFGVVSADMSAFPADITRAIWIRF